MTYYYGGKGGYGVYQKIINQIPPHEVFVEPFLGGGGIIKRKKPANRNIGVDLDPCVIKQWKHHIDIELYCKDALVFLEEFKFTENDFIYADPPYLTRSCKKNKYNFEFTMEEHEKLLALLKKVPCKVMLSGYFSELYQKELRSFRTIQFQTMTRGGYTKTEWLWMNYPEPAFLHDYQYLGSNSREREKLTRKKKCLVERFKKMPKLERQYMLEAIKEIDYEVC